MMEESTKLPSIPEYEKFILCDDESNLEWLDNFDMFDNVFKIHGLLLQNNRPDYDTITLDDQHPDEDMLKVLERHFGPSSDYIQVIFKNNHDKQECQSACPFFRVFMGTINNKTPINYKLENFLKRCKSPWTQVRCEQALVFGIFSATDISRFASVPFEFQNYFESHSECQDNKNITASSSISVKGNNTQLPSDIHRFILLFVVHPCARLIKEYWKMFDNIWDMRFWQMKQEWRNCSRCLH